MQAKQGTTWERVRGAQPDLASPYWLACLTPFLNAEMTQEEVAEKVGVSRQTIIRWSKADAWQELKASQSTTPAKLIQQWQQQINEINQVIAQRDKGARFASPSEADALYKLASAIKKMQDDLGISELIGVCMRFLEWLRPLDVDDARRFSNLMNAFIQDQTSKAKA